MSSGFMEFTSFLMHASPRKSLERLVAAASLVPGDIKLDNAVKLIFLHCLVKRRTGVIKLRFTLTSADVHSAENISIISRRRLLVISRRCWGWIS